MWRRIRSLKPSAAVVFHAPWWVGLAIFMARVPVRVGRHSQWHSFLFFNRGVRQRRHLSEHHELWYNQELCSRLSSPTLLPDSQVESRSLRLVAPSADLGKWRLNTHNYFVVHPGMGGSALNWPSESYIELIRQLLQYRPVVVTGTPADDPYVRPLFEQLNECGGITWLQNRLSTEELLTVYSQASCVVAPSTGVAHIAASLGTPIVGIYSPVLAHSARRWRPLGPYVKVLEPSTPLPAAEKTLKDISVSSVLSAALEIQK